MESKRECELWCESVNPENKAALEAWVRETGICLVQVNGQRKYGGPPPGWVGSPPPLGSEVYIGRLPQDVYEHQLIPLFQRVGRLYEFRLMMTFSGLNRGFAYARYSSRRGAQAAIATLHNHLLRPSCPLLVCLSTEKCELCVDGLPPALTRHGLLLALQPLGPGLQEALLLPSPGSVLTQMALLKFSSHRAAAMAKKALMEGQWCLCGEQVTVEWLKSDLRQLFRKLTGISLKGLQPEGSTLSLARDKVDSQGARAALQLLCQQMKLGSPVFHTKCLGTGPAGWHHFWYQVVIPGHPVPFSGLIWVVLTLDGQDGHEVAKDAVSARLLETLGESWASLLCSAETLGESGTSLLCSAGTLGESGTSLLCSAGTLGESGTSLLCSAGTLGESGTSLLCSAETLGVSGTSLLCSAETLGESGTSLLCSAGTLGVSGASLLCSAGTLGESGASLLCSAGTLGESGASLLCSAGTLGVSGTSLLCSAGTLGESGASLLCSAGTLGASGASLLCSAGTLGASGANLLWSAGAEAGTMVKQ